MNQTEWHAWSLSWNEGFDDVIFTNECSVHKLWEITQSCHFGESGNHQKWRADQSTLTKFMMGRNYKKRCNNVVIFPCIMDAELYTEHILKNTLLLFNRDKFTDGHRFQQDNDPKNTIRWAKQFMDKESINRWKTPPESSDMNPITSICGTNSSIFFLRLPSTPRITHTQDPNTTSCSKPKTLPPKTNEKKINLQSAFYTGRNLIIFKAFWVAAQYTSKRTDQAWRKDINQWLKNQSLLNSVSHQNTPFCYKAWTRNCVYKNTNEKQFISTKVSNGPRQNSIPQKAY